jgi:uncharacterized protein (DUF924 family)
MTGGVKPDAGAAIAPSDVLAFWRAAGPEKWFDKDAAFDSAIAGRFFWVWRAAGDGELAHWQERPEGAARARHRARPVPAQHVSR